MRRLLCSALVLAAASCSKNTSDLALFHEDGRVKPFVAIAPVIDATSFDASWSLSEELTSLVVQHIGKDSGIFVSARDELGLNENPFGKDLSWIKREFPQEPFVLFLELVEHDYALLGKGRKKMADLTPFEASANLKSAIKVRLVDMRGASPKIVLQELIRDAYYVPKNTIPTDYTVAAWGTDAYASSPMGLAHKQLAGEIAQRVRDYVHLAKSR